MNFDARKVRHYCLGKDLVPLDELIINQNKVPDWHSRNEMRQILRDMGWEFAGRHRIDGGEGVPCWQPLDNDKDLRWQVKRLELLDKRQVDDMNAIEKMLELGFSREDCMKYLQMLYFAKLEELTQVTDREKEIIRFADRVEIDVRTKVVASKLIHNTAVMFYVNKFYPECLTDDIYLMNSRRAYVTLGWDWTDPTYKKLEWSALKFAPHFLDLVIKLSDEGDYPDFKRFLVETFITPTTIDKFFKNGIDYRVLSAMAVMARRLDADKKQVLPPQIDSEVAIKILKHIGRLKELYGK